MSDKKADYRILDIRGNDEYDPMHDFILRFEVTECKKIIDELQPFLDDLKSASLHNQKLFRAAYGKFDDRSRQAYALQTTLTQSYIEDTSKIKNPFSVREQIYTLFSYLGLVESIGNCHVDILVMLMVSTGRDFHIESRYTTPRIRHLMSIDDIEKEKIPLTTKLNFLRDNGLKTFPSVIDSQLRNDIAHLNFYILKNEVYIRKKRSSDVLPYSLMKIILAMSSVAVCLYELAGNLGWVKKQTNTSDTPIETLEK